MRCSRWRRKRSRKNLSRRSRRNDSLLQLRILPRRLRAQSKKKGKKSKKGDDEEVAAKPKKGKKTKKAAKKK